jgi:hypothetical protein
LQHQRSQVRVAEGLEVELGWWKVDRPEGPGPESTIGTIIVEA